MPVAERALKTLKCVNPRGDEVDVLLLKWPADSDAWAICLPCRVSSTGIILAVPGDAIPEEDLERGQQAAADDLMGPNAQVTVSLQENADQIIEVQMSDTAWKEGRLAAVASTKGLRTARTSPTLRSSTMRWKAG